MPARYGGFFDYDAKKERLEEVSRELELPEVWNRPERAQELGRERARLTADLEQLDTAGSALANASELLELAAEEGDDATIAGIEKELPAARIQRSRAGIPPHVPRRDGFTQCLRGYPGWRRGHRGTGLGADADAHVPALGRGAWFPYGGDGFQCR